MDTNLPNKIFFSDNFRVDVFSIHYCSNFIIGYNFGNIFTMQPQETWNTSNQSCFTANKRCRYSNNPGRCHYSMYLQNSFLKNLALSISIFGLVIFADLHSRKLKLCRGCLLSNGVKIMLFISDVQYYIPIKLCKTAGRIHLFKTTGMLKPENVKLK